MVEEEGEGDGDIVASSICHYQSVHWDLVLGNFVSVFRIAPFGDGFRHDLQVIGDFFLSRISAHDLD